MGKLLPARSTKVVLARAAKRESYCLSTRFSPKDLVIVGTAQRKTSVTAQRHMRVTANSSKDRLMLAKRC
ncbi:hypothetical protein GCM10025779_20980 [Arthrobacter cryoconiti]